MGVQTGVACLVKRSDEELINIPALEHAFVINAIQAAVSLAVEGSLENEKLAFRTGNAAVGKVAGVGVGADTPLTGDCDGDGQD